MGQSHEDRIEGKKPFGLDNFLNNAKTNFKLKRRMTIEHRMQNKFKDIHYFNEEKYVERKTIYNNMTIGIKKFAENMVNKNNVFTGFKDEKKEKTVEETMIEEIKEMKNLCVAEL